MNATTSRTDSAGPTRMYRKWVFPTCAIPIIARQYRHGTHWAHDHDFFEIALILAGGGTHCCARGESEFSPGSVFVIHPGAWHAFRSPGEFLVYNCCFGIELIDRELQFIRDDYRLNYLLGGGKTNAPQARGVIDLHLAPQAQSNCMNLLNDLGESIQQAVGRLSVDHVGYLMLYLGELARHLGPENEAIARLTPPPHAVATRATRFLQNDPALDWTLEMLAEHVGADESHLIRLFRETTGLSPMAYLSHVRIERAATLLLSTNASVAEIGAQVGWHDPNYFARRFRLQVGMSASEYRRHHASCAPRFGPDPAGNPRDEGKDVEWEYRDRETLSETRGDSKLLTLV